MDKVVEIISDVLSSNSKTIRVNKEDMLTKDVQAVFSQINSDIVEYALIGFCARMEQVKNKKAYLITTLYNEWCNWNTE